VGHETATLECQQNFVGAVFTIVCNNKEMSEINGKMVGDLLKDIWAFVLHRRDDDEIGI